MDRHEIDDAHLVQVRTRNLHEFIVNWVRQIGIPPGRVFEGDNECMRVALVEVFRADVVTGLYCPDRFNSVLQVEKGTLNFGDIRLARPVFEFEENNVTEDLGGRCNFLFFHVYISFHRNTSRGKQNAEYGTANEAFHSRNPFPSFTRYSVHRAQPPIKQSRN